MKTAQMLLLGLLGRGSTATPYYVSKSGNDSTGTGSAAAPWLTLAKAFSAGGVPTAGNAIVFVGDGTYAESTSGGGRLLISAKAYTSRVTFKAVNAGAVTVTGTGADIGNVVFGSNSKNIAFDGINFSAAVGSTYTVLFANNTTGIENITFMNGAFTNDRSGGSVFQFGTGGGSQVTNLRWENATITASGTSGIAISLAGRAASSLYIDEVDLINCTVTGVSRGVQFENLGWVRDVRITGGTYSVTGTGGTTCIGERSPSATGAITNVALDGVTITGNGHGVEFGGTSGAHVTNIVVTDCDIDVSANKMIALYPRLYVDGFTVTGGTYIGGNTNGYGAFGSDASNTDFELAYATFTSVAPDPVSNRVLAAGIAGCDGILVHHNTFTGDGRGITLQDGCANAVIEDNVSTAEDYGFRVGHDGEPPHSTHDVIFRRNTITSLHTLGMVLGQGAWNVEVYDNVVSGGDGCLRMRGDSNNDNIVVRNNQWSRNPSGTGSSPLFEFSGTRNLTFTDNDIEIETGQLWNTALENVTEQVQDVDVTGNRITISGGTVYAVGAGTLGSGVVFNANAYTVSGGATFGTLLGTTVADLPAARTVWNGYGDGTNDDSSTAA